MEVIHASRSSPWRVRWSLENYGAAKSNSQGGVVRVVFAAGRKDYQRD